VKNEKLKMKMERIETIRPGIASLWLGTGRCDITLGFLLLTQRLFHIGWNPNFGGLQMGYKKKLVYNLLNINSFKKR